jgi:hypothetical protein
VSGAVRKNGGKKRGLTFVMVLLKRVPKRCLQGVFRKRNEENSEYRAGKKIGPVENTPETRFIG